MGMYTEFHFNVELKRDTPEDVLRILRAMVDGAPVAGDLPTHPFFRSERWMCLFTMDSYYFAADTHSTLRFDDIAQTHFLCVRSNLKNYGNEIENFTDWIMPYIAAAEGDFLGFSRYEQSEEPTLIRATQSAEDDGDLKDAIG